MSERRNITFGSTKLGKRRTVTRLALDNRNSSTANGVPIQGILPFVANLESAVDRKISIHF